MYKIIKTETPSYLNDLLPSLVNDVIIILETVPIMIYLSVGYVLMKRLIFLPSWNCGMTLTPNLVISPQYYSSNHLSDISHPK